MELKERLEERGIEVLEVEIEPIDPEDIYWHLRMREEDGCLD